MRVSAPLLFACSLLVPPTPAVADCAWDSGLAAVFDGPVRALAVFDEGDGPRLFAGGDFLHAGGVDAAYVARWDGQAWSAVGNAFAGGFVGGSVQALAVWDDGSGAKLYAGGAFHVPGLHVAAWNGSFWTPLGVAGAGQGTNGDVFALVGFDPGSGADLYLGGEFSMAGLVSAAGVARWDGSAWHALIGPFSPPSLVSGSVYALASWDDGGGADLYAGGAFTVVVKGATNLARWDGTDWAKLGASGPGGRVDTLAAQVEGSGPTLVAGGAFTTVDALAALRVARWDGSGWSALEGPLGNGMNARVRTLAIHDDVDGPMLYAAGDFTAAGGSAAGYSARWTGDAWQKLPDPSGMGLNQPAFALLSYDDGRGPALWAGGNFTMAGDEASSYLARWTCGLIFKDGVESGFVSAWDAAVGAPGGP